jgi:hypothetical protein
MATLYFNAAVNGDWATLGNWWMDSGHTTPATGLPTSSDSVIVSQEITANSGSEPTVVNFTQNPGPTLIFDITVTGMATFQDSVCQATITGNATFSGYSSNSGTVTGDATFNDSAGNFGTVTGNATFNDLSYNGSETGVLGTGTFNDDSYNVYQMSGPCTFNHRSSLASGGNVDGNCVFNDSSFVADSTSIGGDATFRGSSYNGAGEVGVMIYGTVSFEDRTPYPIPRGINGSSILGVL